MSLEQELLAELKALRAGTGLTEPRLREQPLLNLHIAGDTYGERMKKLIELVDRIHDREQRIAVRYAFGIEGGHHRQTKDRRAEALKLMPMSLRTLDRREESGLGDVARFIIEESPQLTEAERQDEIDRATSMATRLSDLEFLVFSLARMQKLRWNHPVHQPDWVKFVYPSWYRKLKQRHAAVQATQDRDWEEYNAKLYALIERIADEGTAEAWKSRFIDDI
ncbi:hypothetical protein QWJ26_26485 [Streptomyces sp. CSDS2]|uniref:hypothetical protein n=1 Tax=Streptomyces sp. CSDS2 TaxID=3055051 RepID=UPI0025B1D155|nr:hypothetical protein [Streptomyces sp. CSDS2]MDN3263293.1 hypothetical protein [Streptomyces sp. CSDS2]